MSRNRPIPLAPGANRVPWHTPYVDRPAALPTGNTTPPARPRGVPAPGPMDHRGPRDARRTNYKPQEFPTSNPSVIGSHRGDLRPGAVPRIRCLSLPLATVAASPVALAEVTVGARVTVPSSRVRVKITVAFKGDAGDGAARYTPDAALCAVTMRAIGKDESRADVWLGDLVTNQALPYSYEVDTAVESVSLEVTLKPLVAVTGEWRVIVTWEPEDTMDDARWAQLYSRCSLSAGKAKLLSLLLPT